MRRFLFAFFCVPSFEERGGVGQLKRILPSRERVARDVLRFSLVAICISKQVCGNLLARRAYGAHKGVFYRPAPTHYRPEPSEGCARRRPVLPRAEPSQLAFRFSLPSPLPFWPSQRAPPTHPSVRPSLPTSRSCLVAFWSLRPSEKVGGGPAGCVVRKSQGANGSLHAPLPPLCAPRSVHERAPVKIDLLKGQQPLNLLPQEAFSTPQGDCTPYTLHRMAQRQRGCARSGGTFLRERRSVPDGRTDGRTGGPPAHFSVALPLFLLRTLFWQWVSKPCGSSSSAIFFFFFYKPSKLH